MGWPRVIPLLSNDKRLMNKNLRKSLLLLTILLPLTACGGDDDNGNAPSDDTPKSAALKNYAPARTLAFPGADGGASNMASGGAERDVYIVTSLADDYQPGTLRAAVSNGKRTIVFAVAGQIDLQSKLNISASDITIAGQSAPGDGITIAGYPVYISGSNIILRYLRFRMGDQNIDKSNFNADDGDALGGKGGKNIIIDHCSVSWSTDECASFSRVENFTMQYCIISESLKLSGHSKGNHGYGGIWGGRNAAYHHNLLAHHDSRNPRFDHQYVGHEFLGPIDYINNVVYDWGGNSTYGGETASETNLFHINMMGNSYKAGPSTSSGSKNRLMQLTSLCENCNKYVGQSGKDAYPAKLFIDDNKVNAATATWDNIHKDSKETRDSKAMAKLDSRWTENLVTVTFVESADNAYNTVLTYAGASLKRDAVDLRIINDVKNGTGSLINAVSDTPGYPTLNAGTSIIDTDKDGMPDEWEMEQMKALGVTDKTINDFKPGAYNLTAKYTNLEVYLNSLVSNTFPAGAKATEIR